MRRLDSRLKAYIRWDGNGRIVNNILSRVKPRNGKWSEGETPYLCCNSFDEGEPSECVTYAYLQGEESSVLLSYTDCDGQAVGPRGIMGTYEVVFCCMSGTVVVEISGGVAGTLTLIGEGCLVVPT